MRTRGLVLVLLLLGPAPLVDAKGEPTVVQAVAVAETAEGLVGSVAKISIVQEPGTGLLFLDTQPFTQVDLQGSARVAVRVAGATTGIDVSQRDFFIVVRSESAVIGGPSAGGVLAVGAVAALQGWPIDPDVYMTGTINIDGSIGPVGGIPEKARAAAERGGRLFLFPVGEEETIATGPQGRTRVNMTQFCNAELGMECRPVAELEEAVTAFTGFGFERPALPTEGLDERFREVMRPLASRELERAGASLAQARARMANESANAWSDLRVRFNEAESLYATGRQVFDEEHYYTAASRAFVTSVNTRYVLSGLDFLASSDRVAFVDERIAEAETQVAEARERALGASARGLSELEAVGAAGIRVLQAEQNLARAREGRAANEGSTALYYSAFAWERAATVGWWLEIGQAFSEGSLIPYEQQAVEAKEAIAEGIQFVAYAESTLQGAGGLASIVGQLESAQEALDRGFAAAGIYEALEAQVRAGLTIELFAYGDTVPAARLQAASNAAKRAIAEARAQGVEPVLAASQAELAGDFADSADQLAFFDLARIVARSHEFFERGFEAEPVGSRYTGSPQGQALVEQVALYVSLLVAGGVLGGLTVASIMSRSRRPQPKPALPSVRPVAPRTTRKAARRRPAPRRSAGPRRRSR